MKIAFLGPAGTFTEDALREAMPDGEEIEAMRTATIHDAIVAVERGEAERALVPFENSIEGSVRSTLDTLAFDTEKVTIIGEHDFRVHAHLIAREGVELEQISAILSHPHPCPVRRVPAREPAGGRTAQRQQHRRGGAHGRRVGPTLGRDRRSRRRRPLRLHRAARGDRGPGRQRDPLRLDFTEWTPSGTGRPWRLARLLRARRRSSRGPGGGSAGVLRAARST